MYTALGPLLFSLIPVMPVQEQEDGKFNASLGYIMRPFLKTES